MMTLIGTIALTIVSYAIGWHCRSIQFRTDEHCKAVNKQNKKRVQHSQ